MYFNELNLLLLNLYNRINPRNKTISTNLFKEKENLLLVQVLEKFRVRSRNKSDNKHETNQGLLSSLSLSLFSSL